MNRSPLVFRFLGSLIFVLWMLIMPISALYVIKARLDGGVPTLAGHKTYLVVSGSKHPTFKAGSVIVVKKLASSQIRKGDIITYKDPTDETRTITRQVKSIIGNGEEISFVIQEKNTNLGRAVIPGDNLIGRVEHWVPYLGYILALASTKIGLVVLFVIPGLILIFSEVKSFFRAKNEYTMFPTRHQI